MAASGPTFHDEYLPTFNLPHVHAGRYGADRRAGDQRDGAWCTTAWSTPLDVLIYATGFEWMAHARRSTWSRGRDGQTLREKWESEGTRTFLGLHSHGFPNLFIITGPQGGGGSFNFTDAIDEHADYVVWMLETMRENAARRWSTSRGGGRRIRRALRQADIATAPLRDCISYYNGHGTAEPGSLAYYGGGQRWHKRRMTAQETMEPYLFDYEGEPVTAAAE